MGPKEALYIKKDSIFLRQSEHSSDQGAFTVNLTISNSKFRYVFTETVPKGWKLLAAFYFLHLGRNNEKNVHHLSTRFWNALEINYYYSYDTHSILADFLTPLMLFGKY